MRIVRVMPVFNKNGEVEFYIPSFQGFHKMDEINALTRVDEVIGKKKWAFTEHSLPEGYEAVSITLDNYGGRINEIREAGIATIGYNIEMRIGIKDLMAECDMAAIDVQSPHVAQLFALAGAMCRPDMPKIAINVDTLPTFEKAKKIGFDYFIGDFYTKSVLVDGQARARLGPSQATKLSVLSEVSKWESNSRENIAQIARIIQRDVFLTLSLIKLANSAFFGGLHKIVDLKEAIVRIGLDNLSKWSIAILTTAVTESKMPEIARAALVRARFMENIAVWVSENRWMSFFTGLASMSDVMLGASIDEALADLNAPPEVRKYLDYEGGIGRLYGIVVSYLAGNVQNLEFFLKDSKDLSERLNVAYISAELWVNEVLRSVSA